MNNSTTRKMNNFHKTCVICCSKIDSNSSSPFDTATEGLEAQLNVIFLLRNVLELEAFQVENYLRRWNNPENWVKVCGSCEFEIVNTRVIYEMFNELRRKYELKKHELLQKMMKTAAVEVGNFNRRNLGMDEILKECRSSIKRRKLSVVPTPEPVLSPFVAGDRRAAKLARRMRDGVPESDRDRHTALLSMGIKKERDEVEFDSEDDQTSPGGGGQDNEDMLPFMYCQTIMSQESDEPMPAAPLNGSRNSDLKLRPMPLSKRQQILNKHRQQQQQQQPMKRTSPPRRVNANAVTQSPNQPLPRGRRPKSASMPSSLPKSVDGPWLQSSIRCNLCKKSAETFSYRTFALHIFNYHQHRWSCTQCPIRFKNTSDQIKFHWNRYHKDLLHLPHCSRFNKDPEGTKIPLPDIPWWCPGRGCSWTFSDEESRDVHLNTCPNFNSGIRIERTSECTFCQKRYFCEEELLMHRVLTHQFFYLTKTPKCECGAVFNTRFQLFNHRKKEGHKMPEQKKDQPVAGPSSSIGDRKHANSTKEKKKWAAYELDMSKVTLLPLNPAGICNICQKHFSKFKDLKNHVKKVHDNHYESECEICGAKFKYPYHLKGHMATEHSIGNFKCGEAGCGKVFISEQILTQHLEREHSAEAMAMTMQLIDPIPDVNFEIPPDPLEEPPPPVPNFMNETMQNIAASCAQD